MTDAPFSALEFVLQAYTTPFTNPADLHESAKEILSGADWGSPPLLIMQWENGDAVVAFMDSDEFPEVDAWVPDALKAVKANYTGDGKQVVSVSLYNEGWLDDAEDGTPQDEARMFTTVGHGFVQQSLFSRLTGEWRDHSGEIVGNTDASVLQESLKEVSA